MTERILIVDDEPDLLNLLKVVLEKSGYEVLTEKDGSKAVDSALREYPDLVLCDLILPVMTGFDVCRILRANPQTGKTPIILMSVLERDVDKRMAKDAGANMFLSKPIDTGLLLESVEKLLKEYHNTQFSSNFQLEFSDFKSEIILFEHRDSTPYEQSIKAFAYESYSNNQKVLGFAPREVSLYVVLQNLPILEVVPVDAHTILSPTLDKYEGELAVVYDTVTDLALSRSFEFAYEKLKQVKRRFSEKKATSIITLNGDAHSAEEIARFGTLFTKHIRYDKTGYKIMKWT